MGHVITSASLSLLAAVFLTISTQQPADAADFYLRHLEWKPLRWYAEGGSVSPGVAIVTSKTTGTVLYLDDSNRIRTRVGDYCVVTQGGVLVFGVCGGISTDWRYSTTDRFYSIVLGTQYASFNNKQNVLLGTDKMTPKTYIANQTPKDFLAGWFKQDV